MSDLTKQVAKQLFTKSLPLKKGSSVVIETWDGNEDIARSVELEARARGHSTLTIFNDSVSFVEYADKLPKNMKLSLGKHEISLLRSTDGYVFIPGPELSFASTSLDQAKLSAATSYNMEWYRTVGKTRLRGIRITAGYVNSEKAAASLGKSRQEVVDHLLKASLVDPSVLGRKGKAITKGIAPGSTVRVEGDGASLTFRAGKEEELDDGRTDEEDLKMKTNMSNLPGGLYSRNVSGAAKGTVRCSSLAMRGRRAPSVELEFSGGKLVSYAAEDWDESSRQRFDKYIKEQSNRRCTYFGIGLNPGLERGYGRDLEASGSLAIWIGPGSYATVSHPTLACGKEKLIVEGALKI